MIALILAARYEVESLALLAPAVTNTNRLILLSPFLRHFARRLPNSVNFEGQDPDDPDINYPAEEYWRWKWPGPAAELFKLQRSARRSAKKIEAATMLIVSEADSTVPLKVKPILEKLLGSQLMRVVVLEKSEHTLTTGCERERVVAEVADWFGKATSRQPQPL